MKGMILAAGFGTRLWPLTEDRTKPAIPFLNRPLIAYSVVFIVIPGVWNNFGAIFVRLGVFAVIYAVIAGIAGIVASVRNNCKADDLEYESQFGEFFTTKKR